MENATRRTFVAGAAVTAAAATLASSAVSALAEETPSYTPGTYSAEAFGIGTVTVEVTFSETGIEDVKVDAKNESKEIGGAVADILAEAVIAAQGPVIDTIGGCTVTSRAVQEAVANCIAQATVGAEPSKVDFVEPIAPVDAPEAWDFETPVVFVGSNLGGLMCAARLAQNGIASIVLEQNSEKYIAGTGQRVDMWQVYGGCKFMADHPDFGPDYGYFGSPYHDIDVINWHNEHTRWTVNRELLRNMVVCEREFTDWMTDNGAEIFSYLHMTSAENPSWWIALPSDANVKNKDQEEVEVDNDSYMGRDIAMFCKNIMDETGLSSIMFDTKVTALVMEDGKCTGVQAVTHDMQTIYVKGTEAVVLSADNMQANRHMMQKYCGIGGNMKVGLAGGRGEVIRMAQGAGADMAGIGCFGGTSDNLVVPAGDVDNIHRTPYYNYINGWSRFPGLRINREGTRIGYLNYDMLRAQTDQRMCGDVLEVWARISAEQLARGETFMIFDSNFDAACDVMNTTDIGMHGFQRNTADGVYSGAYHEFPVGKPREWVGEYKDETREAMIADGSYAMADTLEEVAEMKGLDPEIVIAAVEKWNALCDAGVDDPEFGFLPEWLNPVKEPPFYCVETSPGVYSTWCGVKVDPSNRVIDTEGNVIEGLYATFHVAGGLAGEGNPLRGMGDQAGAMMSSGFNISKVLLGEGYELI